MPVPEELQRVADEVRDSGNPQVGKVRNLLSWFGQQRRGRWVVSSIRSALREVELRTEPDFETAYIDGTILFKPVEAEEENEEAGGANEPVGEEDTGLYDDPVARIRMLPAANRAPHSVKRDEPIAKAVTIMLMNDFSQLPVMPDERTVNGLISWRSIGRARSQNRPTAFVRDCMERAVELPDDTPLLEAIEVIAQEEVVLVRAQQDRKISGLITTSDLSIQFHELAEPFLLIAEIENHVRRLIDEHFTVDDLREARSPGDQERQVDGIADLTFGEYARILEDPDNWSRLNSDLDRAEFTRRLHQVREIRNDVMHFSPDGISPEDLELLRDTVRFLQQVR